MVWPKEIPFKRYPSDLLDDEWEIVKPILEKQETYQQFPLSLFRPFSNRSILVIIEYKKRKTKYPLSVQRRLMTYIIKIP